MIKALVKGFCNFWLAPTQQHTHQKSLKDFQTNVVMVQQPHNSNATITPCRMFSNEHFHDVSIYPCLHGTKHFIDNFLGPENGCLDDTASVRSSKDIILHLL
jgi:hypothetical protein